MMKARYERKRDRVVVELNTGIEVAFRPDPTVWDGSFARNA